MLGSRRGSFGSNILFGRVYVPGHLFSAYVLFVDICGSVVQSSAVDIALSYQERYTSAVVLPNNEMALIGGADLNGQSIGLWSLFDGTGSYKHSMGLVWADHVSVSYGMRLKSDEVIYVGFAGEGLNYHDAFVALGTLDGAMLWAKRYSYFGQDEAFAVSELEGGVVVTGMQNAGKDGFILYMDYTGAIMKQVCIRNIVLRLVIVLRNGFFVAVGQSSDKENSAQIFLVLCDKEANIIKTHRVQSGIPGTSIFPRTGDQLENGNIGISCEIRIVLSGGQVATISGLLEINMDQEILERASYLGDKSGAVKTVGYGLYSSFLSGNSISGHKRGLYESYKYYFAELTADMRLPGYSDYSDFLSGEIVLLLEAINYTFDAQFHVSEVADFRAVLLPATLRSEVRVTESITQLGATCNAIDITPPPSAAPTSRAPTWTPTMKPSPAPPSHAPVTAAPTASGETNPPTTDPSTARPTIPPTHSPTGVPTLLPSVHPSSVPTTIAPSTVRPTRVTLPPTGTASPTVTPTFEPTKLSNAISRFGNNSTVVVVGLCVVSGLICALLCSCCYFAFTNLSFRLRENRSSKILKKRAPRKDTDCRTEEAQSDGNVKLPRQSLPAADTENIFATEQRPEEGKRVTSLSNNELGFDIKEFYGPLSDDDDASDLYSSRSIALESITPNAAEVKPGLEEQKPLLNPPFDRTVLGVDFGQFFRPLSDDEESSDLSSSSISTSSLASLS